MTIINNIRRSLCPINLFFEGDESRCNQALCDYDAILHGCGCGCQEIEETDRIKDLEEQNPPDICMNCGREQEQLIYPEECECETPCVVHQVPCFSDNCKNTIGVVLVDDWQAVEKAYCTTCITRIKYARIG